MISKISDSLQTNSTNHRSIASSSSSLHSWLSEFLALGLLALIFGGLGWLALPQHSPLGTVLLILATVGVRYCWLAGPEVWAGLLSLTFSTTWILAGALTESDIYGWVVAITLSGMGVFLLDVSLSHLINRLRQTGWRHLQIFWLLAIVCTLSATAGGILPILWKV
ncbi:MAG: hypothetical protein IGS38_10615 [Synechococcales cyanobacterium M58_A2018_015]|nr:hypothetical protein [Synechococcales cyanobacterium M58_A2018_015]